MRRRNSSASSNNAGGLANVLEVPRTPLLISGRVNDSEMALDQQPFVSLQNQTVIIDERSSGEGAS